MSGEVHGWERLADLVRAARYQLGMTSQVQLAEAAGVAVGTVQRLEGGKPYPRLPNRTPAIEKALGWPPGTARRVVEGDLELTPGPTGDDDRRIPEPSASGENAAREALEMIRSLEPEEEEAYRAALDFARSLSRSEKRRLIAELFDDPDPMPSQGERLVAPRED